MNRPIELLRVAEVVWPVVLAWLIVGGAVAVAFMFIERLT